MGFTRKELQKLNAGNEKCLLYVSRFSGFTWDLFNFDLAIDNDYNFRLGFSYFDPKMEIPMPLKPKFYFEGKLPKFIKEILQELLSKNLIDIYAYNSPEADKYVPDDSGHDSYKFKNGNDFLGATLYSTNPSHIERFENSTGKQFYSLHCKIIEWLESFYHFVRVQHYKNFDNTK